MSNQNEKNFFQQVISSPGWNVHLSKDIQIGGNEGISNMDTCLYMVDTTNGWMAMGSLNRTGFERARQETQEHGLSIEDLRGGLAEFFHELAVKKVEAPDSQIHACVQLAAACLFETGTYEKAMQAEQWPQQWIYMLYKTASGNKILRPFCMHTANNQMLSKDQVVQAVKSVVELDTTNRQTQVFQTLQKSGGVEVAPEFKSKHRGGWKR